MRFVFQATVHPSILERLTIHRLTRDRRPAYEILAREREGEQLETVVNRYSSPLLYILALIDSYNIHIDLH